MKLFNMLVGLGLVCANTLTMAAQPGEIVFLSTPSDIYGCYFKKGEESSVKNRLKNTFSFGEKVCMRAYTTGKIGSEINMQDFHDGNFYKGYVFNWKHTNGDSGFWMVANAIADLRPLPKGKHCIQMYVTGPDDNGNKPAHRRLAAKGCFTVN